MSAHSGVGEHLRSKGTPMCRHQPACPSADAPDRDAARVVASHPEQGWSLLCNGVVAFDDEGDILPDGSAIAPQRRSMDDHAHVA
jgi:hypothetical protein